MVRVVLPETLPSVAVIVAVPAPRAVNRPLEPGASEMTEMPFVAPHVTVLVISCVVLSENLPWAVN